MNKITDVQLDVLIKSAVNSSGPLPPDEKFVQIISALSELRELRAVMLQGAKPVQEWIPCSERMPESGQKVLTYRPDAPESDDPLIRMATYVGRSAHGHGFDCYCKPSHWMALPAAPQQEVK